MDLKPNLLYLENKTAQSLHDRFSEVLLEQLTQRKVVFKGRQKAMVLRLRNVPRSRSRIKAQGATQKDSVWARIGWDHPWRRGVWNFMNKYHRRVRFNPAPRFKFSSGVLSRFSPAHSSRFSPAHSSRFMSLSKSRFSLTLQRVGLRGGLRWRRGLRLTPRSFKRAALSTVLKKRRLQGSVQRLVKVKSVQSRLGVASVLKRCVQKKALPTKKQLDMELDQYMSLSRSRLDQQLDNYMSMSRSRLDAELDEYMAMAGPRGEGQGEEGPGEGL